MPWHARAPRLPRGPEPSCAREADDEGRTGAKNRGATALAVAARAGHARVVALLLASRGGGNGESLVDVNAVKNDHSSALSLAAQEGQ